jgi:hypothetical protein
MNYNIKIIEFINYSQSINYNIFSIFMALGNLFSLSITSFLFISI